MPQERIQKILAQAGITSRRKAEQLIKEGLVTVNGKVATIGEKADLAEDAIKVEGKLLQTKRPPMYIAFHKPRGVISMFADPEGRPTLGDFLARIKERLFPIGRLDFNSEGLILLTNDGAFAEKLQKRSDIARVYQVKVRGHVEPADLAKLERGAKVGERAFKPHSVRLAGNLASKSVIEWVTLESGAMDVKGAFESRGFLVEKITRTAIGHINLRGIAPGEHKLLKASQVEALLNQPELGMRALAEDAEAAVPFVQKDEETGEVKVVKSAKVIVKAPRGDAREERPKRSFGARREFGSRGDGPKRFGDRKPSGDRKPYGDRKPFGDRKPYGDRKPFGASSAAGGKIKPRDPNAPMPERPAREFKPGGYKAGGFKSGGFKSRGFGGEDRGGYKSRGGFGSDRGPSKFKSRSGGGFNSSFGRAPEGEDRRGEGFRSRAPRAGFKSGGGYRSGGAGAKSGGGGRIQVKRRTP
jgi:23S rRNA pseudouridine2605 synthase